MAEVRAADDPYSDGAATSATFAELRGGTRLGRYELLVPIATGGMARVWAARQHGQRGFSKLVAIKTILPHLAREPEFERMFLDEARIASLVHHPNVAEIYELGEEAFGARGASILYLAMEWVNGDSLMRVLRSGAPGGDRVKADPIDLRVAVRIIADAAAGLHAAHELKDDDGVSLGVVHRDVSPHNLLLSADGHVKVADFGVAKALGGTQSQTAAGQIKGKLAYMAPEQVTGGAIDRTSDVFALGCVLYEATTGEPPFRGEADHQVMHALLSGKYLLPSKALVGFPIELETIIVHALATRPEDRFPTAEKMRHALEEWLASSGGIVTSNHVAVMVRERIGSVIDKRKEKIRAASSAAGDGATGASSVDARKSDLTGGEPEGGAATPSPSEAGYGSSSGIQRLQGSATRFGPPTPHGAYDPRRSTSGPSQTLPLEPSAGGSGPRYDPRASMAVSSGGSSSGYDHRLPPQSASGSGVAAILRDVAAGPQRYAIAAAIGVAVAVALGLLLILVVHLARGPRGTTETPITPATTSSATASSPPTVATAAATTPIVPATPTPAPTSTAAPTVGVRATPALATLTLDGVRLPPGTRDVARPAAGKTSVLLVQAEGFHEETRVLDERSPPSIDVVLAKKRAHPVLPANPY